MSNGYERYEDEVSGSYYIHRDGDRIKINHDMHTPTGETIDMDIWELSLGDARKFFLLGLKSVYPSLWGRLKAVVGGATEREPHE